MFKDEINWHGLNIALASLIPIFLVYWWSENSLLLYTGLITISLVIPKNKLALNNYYTIGQFLAIICCFSLLYFSYHIHFLFIIFTSLLAFLSVAITKISKPLRSLTNYIFIPALYISCEFRATLPSSKIVSTYIEFIKISPIALVIVLLVFYLAAHYSKIPKSEVNFNTRPDEHWYRPAYAIFLSVFIATALGFLLKIHNLQWLIWSSASIVLSGFQDVKNKLKQRIIGAAIGLPTGLIFSSFLPKIELFYILSLMAIFLTLISFKNYLYAFTSRCFFIAVAANLSYFASQITSARVENVIIGGAIGLVSSYIFVKQGDLTK